MNNMTAFTGIHLKNDAIVNFERILYKLKIIVLEFTINIKRTYLLKLILYLVRDAR